MLPSGPFSCGRSEEPLLHRYNGFPPRGRMDPLGGGAEDSHLAVDLDRVTVQPGRSDPSLRRRRIQRGAPPQRPGSSRTWPEVKLPPRLGGAPSTTA
jgi:hypothetical protein